MVIEAISDTHNNRHKKVKLKGADVLIHAGDFTNYGEYGEVNSFFEWFKKVDGYKHKIIIPGNHDITFEDKPDWILKLIKKLGKNIHYLENDGIEIKGIKFYGIPITPTFGNWAFMGDEKERIDYYSKIPADTDVLITHGPPLGILDANRYGMNCGCQYIESFSQNVKAHIFGHIHEGYGSRTIGDKTFYNVSTFKVFGDPSIVNESVIINL